MRLLLIVAAVTAPTLADASIRCDGRVLTVGASALELEVHCGPPDLRETRPVLRSVGVEGPRLGLVGANRGGPAPVVIGPPTVRVEKTVRELVESWMYKGRKGDLGRVVTVERGAVTAIETLRPFDEDPGCERGLIGPGLRLVEVFSTCGAPTQRSTWEEEDTVELGGIARRQLSVFERWAYHPGPGRFVRELLFRDGRLIDVKTGRKL